MMEGEDFFQPPEPKKISTNQIYLVSTLPSESPDGGLVACEHSVVSFLAVPRRSERASRMMIAEIPNDSFLGMRVANIGLC
jgi:hypothetical protein